MTKNILIVLVFISLLIGCGKPTTTERVRIAINAWPGYEYLYLASEKGFFAEEGLNVEIVEMSSLADVQRIYVQGRVDGFGSTVIEAVQAAGITQQALKIILIPDFSFGSDVIIGNEKVTSVKSLKGLKVGAEVGSLGMFVLHSALVKHGLSLDDVVVVNVEQLDAEKAMKNREIDAMVTYPPHSIDVSKLAGMKQVFDTRDIPGQVIDTVSIRAGAIADEALFIEKFHRVWQRSLDFAQSDQQEAYQIMAKREGISVNEFAEATRGLTVVQSNKQQELLSSQRLKDNIIDVCQVLERSKLITFECDNIGQLVKGSVSQ